MHWNLVLHTDWGSLHADHRDRIYAELANIKNRREPRPTYFSSSISHCQTVGGFFTAETVMPHQLGFDIEDAARATTEIVRRVCKNEEELKAAPHPAILWSAKEATFKSLRDISPIQTISEIQFESWTERAPQCWSFSFADTHPKKTRVRGIALFNGSQSLALAWTRL